MNRSSNEAYAYQDNDPPISNKVDGLAQLPTVKIQKGKRKVHHVTKSRQCS